MSPTEVICRVKALYPYESNDPSSLSFKANAIISVLAQLESGWWDGWSDGKRGWFPSNYVEILPDEELPSQQWKYSSNYRQRVLDQDMQKQLRLSLHASDMLVPPQQQQRQDVPSSNGWVLQTTEDGSEQYYYNTETQEMRYSMPPDFYSEEKVNQIIHFQSNSSLHDEYERPPTRPVRAANRTTTDTFYGQNNQYNRVASAMMDAEFENSEKLPPNWVRKATPKGRYYYCNIKTEETTWHLEDIDPDTGILMSSATDSYPTTPNQTHNTLLETTTKNISQTSISQDSGPISWQNISTLIAQSISNLKETVRQDKNGNLTQDTTLIVHRVRILLYVTNCLDKETSPQLRSNKQLRSLHRVLLASVAKLVLDTKVAATTWSTQSNKLQADADECLVAVRNFMSQAQESQVELKQDKPILSFEQTIWRSQPLKATGTSLILGKPDTITAIGVLSDHVRTAIHSYQEGIKNALDINDKQTKLRENAPLLVAQFRNLSNTTSHFLNVLEEICQTQSNDPRATMLAKAKKPIYSAMGTLFIVSQTITSNSVSSSQITSSSQKLDDCFQLIESSLKQVMEAIQTKVDESLIEPPKPLPSLARLYSNEDFQQPPMTPGATTMTVSSFTSEFTSMDPPNHELFANNIKRFDFDLRDETSTKRRDTVITSPTLTSTSISNSLYNSETYWFLGSDIDPNEIIYNPQENNVKGGTLRALVQHLSKHDQLDSKFNTTFLLTFRSFCSTQELFNELFNRYQSQPPEGLTPDQIELWQEKKLKLIRLRVFNVIKSWLESYYNEEEDRHILSEISHFTDTVIVDSMKFGADQLSKLVKKRMMAEDSSQIRKMKLNVRANDMPVPILPKNMKRIKLLELDPHELARQMTIMDFKLYNRIKPVECLDKNWGKTDVNEQGHHIAANVKASIEHSNQVTAWVTDSILSKEELKKRAGVLKHWILVAERCRLLNNYNTCMAILSAFDNGSIGRLKRTWELISTRSMLILQNIRKLMGANRNFSEYREIIHKVNPPCIPFLGIYLQDLTFIEDGNSNFLKKSNHLINFAKRMKTAEVIRELQQYQSTHYMLTAVPDIQEFIKTHLHSSREEEELYNLSLRLEPRERGEDTIARRLKESGL